MAVCLETTSEWRALFDTQHTYSRMPPQKRPVMNSHLPPLLRPCQYHITFKQHIGYIMDVPAVWIFLGIFTASLSSMGQELMQCSAVADLISPRIILPRALASSLGDNHPQRTSEIQWLRCFLRTVVSCYRGNMCVSVFQASNGIWMLNGLLHPYLWATANLPSSSHSYAWCLAGYHSFGYFCPNLPNFPHTHKKRTS